MTDEVPEAPQLPEHPELREIAEVVERMDMVGEIFDDRFRSVFLSSQGARAMGVSPEEALGLGGTSLIARTLDEAFAEIVRVTEESGTAWLQHNLPIMRRYVQPDDPDFDEVFGGLGPYAARVDPVATAPRAWASSTAPARRRSATPERSPSPQSSSPLRVECHGTANESFQGLFIDLVALVEVNGAPGVALEAGVEEA
jgi:PAS domain-containing protein